MIDKNKEAKRQMMISKWKDPVFRQKMMKVVSGPKTHGFSVGGKPHFYKVWENIKTRCTAKKGPKYHNYAARGIKSLWVSFEEFKNDMYESYLEHKEKYGQRNTTIDRIDPNGHYCKENCRWATYSQQKINTRLPARGKSLDELFRLAKKILKKEKRIDDSLLQRRLRVGRGKSAYLLNRLEKEGFIDSNQALNDLLEAIKEE
jgi:DNA segregation ATPase FtsK/SpoIIIE-like protein